MTNLEKRLKLKNVVQHMCDCCSGCSECEFFNPEDHTDGD